MNESRQIESSNTFSIFMILVGGIMGGFAGLASAGLVVGILAGSAVGFFVRILIPAMPYLMKDYRHTKYMNNEFFHRFKEYDEAERLAHWELVKSKLMMGQKIKARYIGDSRFNHFFDTGLFFPVAIGKDIALSPDAKKGWGYEEEIEASITSFDDEKRFIRVRV